MRPEESEQPRENRRVPLDYVRDASIVVSLIGFSAQWFPQALVQTVSTGVLGVALACAVGLTIFRHLVVPLIARYLDNYDSNASQHFVDANRETEGIVFQRERDRWRTLLARITGIPHQYLGYRVFMRCPKQLWIHGGIGEATAMATLPSDELINMTIGGGPVGTVEAIAQVKLFVMNHDRRIVFSAWGQGNMETCIDAIMGAHDGVQKLIQPDAMAAAQAGVQFNEMESPDERVERILYQLDTMMRSVCFLTTVHYRLTKTDTASMDSRDFVVGDGTYDSSKYASLPLLIEGDFRVTTGFGDSELLASLTAESLAVGYVIGRKGGSLEDEAIASQISRAVQDADPPAASSLQEFADDILIRLDEIDMNDRN